MSRGEEGADKVNQRRKLFEREEGYYYSSFDLISCPTGETREVTSKFKGINENRVKGVSVQEENC